MHQYFDSDGDKTIVGYRDGDDFIQIHYRDGRVLEVRTPPFGMERVISLRQIARLGAGLAQVLQQSGDEQRARRIE
jgi:hypothetical protein